MLICELHRNGFHIKGHAGFDVHGKDIVCSAVSFLAQAVAQSLDHYVHSKQIIEPGDMSVEIYTTSTESEVILKHFEESMCMISQAYPENVQVKKILESEK